MAPCRKNHIIFIIVFLKNIFSIEIQLTYGVLLVSEIEFSDSSGASHAWCSFRQGPSLMPVTQLTTIPPHSSVFVF